MLGDISIYIYVLCISRNSYIFVEYFYIYIFLETHGIGCVFWRPLEVGYLKWSGGLVSHLGYLARSGGKPSHLELD